VERFFKSKKILFRPLVYVFLNKVEDPQGGKSTKNLK